jgi:hypothetical protein
MRLRNESALTYSFCIFFASSFKPFIGASGLSPSIKHLSAGFPLPGSSLFYFSLKLPASRLQLTTPQASGFKLPAII